MPVPAEYQRATELFYKFLEDVKEISELTSTHQAYTIVQGVLQTFRRRLELNDAVRFANVLPAVVRALFVSDWDTDAPKRNFEDRSAMTKEVQSLRADHNFASESSIRDVATALRRNLDEAAFERVLATLPEGARSFWEPAAGDAPLPGHPPENNTTHKK